MREAGDRKLWNERRSRTCSHGHVVDVVSTAHHLQRSAERQTLIKTSPAQQERHQDQSGRARCTGAHRLRGTFS